MIKRFADIGFFVTIAYGIVNILSIIDAQGNMGFIGELGLSLDVYTWHIFGIFSIVALLVRLLFNRDEVDKGERVKWLDKKAVLHFVFMLISFGGIYYLFENCF